jgi:hypothetical protein
MAPLDFNFYPPEIVEPVLVVKTAVRRTTIALLRTLIDKGPCLQPCWPTIWCQSGIIITWQ